MRRATAGPADCVEPGAVAAGVAAGAGKAGQHLAIGVHGGGELPQNCV
jgi:hypothetical protein